MQADASFQIAGPRTVWGERTIPMNPDTGEHPDMRFSTNVPGHRINAIWIQRYS